MHDHLFVPLTFHVPTAKHRGTPWHFARGLAKEVTVGNSFLANSVFESVAFVRTSQATDVPDLQIHLLPWSYPSPNQDAPIRHKVDPRACVTLLSTLIYPRSRGTLRLASGDPTAAPLIDFQYLAEQGDVEVLAEGCEMIREIMASAAFGGAVKGEVHMGTGFTGRRRCATRSATARPPSTTASAPAGWASTSGPSSAPTSRSAASRASGSPTPRSCRRSPAATRTHRRS